MNALKNPSRRAIALWVGCLLWCAAPAQAVERPLWELALGGGALSVPDYRGAEDNQAFPFPLVYPVYRGPFLRVDDEGVRGLFYETDRVEFDFSVDGTLSRSSDDIEARAGMPDLDPSFQIGPSLKLRLWDRPDLGRDLELNLNVRGAFALSSSPQHIGYASSPHLTYHQDIWLYDRTWRLGLSAGLEFGSDEFHDYYYGIDPQFATPRRPAYEAENGFAGTRFIFTFQGRTRKTWVSFFGRYDHVGGAVFEDSPLVRSKSNITAGFVFTWFVAESKKTVEVRRPRYKY